MVDTGLDDSGKVNNLNEGIVGVYASLVFFASIYNRFDTVNDSGERVSGDILVRLFLKQKERY